MCSVRESVSFGDSLFGAIICKYQYLYIKSHNKRLSEDKMPKAGRYEVPTRTLDDCVSYLRKGWETSKNLVSSRETFCESIGQKPGGNFSLLVGSMSMFQLVDASQGQIRYTELAKKILFGKGDEVARAMGEAVRQIDLFVELFDKYGPGFTDDQVRIFLRERSGADISEINDLSRTVSKLLKSHLQYLTPTKPKEQEEGGESEEMDQGFTSDTESSLPKKLLSFPGNGIKLFIPPGDEEQVKTEWLRSRKTIDLYLGIEEK